MAKLRKNPAAMISAALKQPAVLAIIAIATIILTFASVRQLRKPTVDSPVNSRSQELRARVSEKLQNGFAAGDRRNDARENAIESNTAPSTDASVNNFSSTSSQLNDQASPASTATPVAGSTIGTATAAVTTGAKTSSEPASLQVTFAWAEASREWLQAMGAASPGLHRINDLDAKLRESVGGYRILEVSRQKLNDKAATTTLIHGDRLSVRFESTTANDSTLVGSIQPAMRIADGSVRSPAAAAVSIDKGQGSIVTLGAAASSSAGAGSAGPTGAEIVLLILPRWGANRNP